jgi:hypothetical protein
MVTSARVEQFDDADRFDFAAGRFPATSATALGLPWQLQCSAIIFFLPQFIS